MAWIARAPAGTGPTTPAGGPVQAGPPAKQYRPANETETPASLAEATRVTRPAPKVSVVVAWVTAPVEATTGRLLAVREPLKA